MAINPLAHYQQVLSMALEDRSNGYEDLVSNQIALLSLMKRKGQISSYSGPRIRETLQIGKPTGQWYSGYDFLDNPPVELFNDAYWTPKMLAVPISLTNEEILNNSGEAQIMDVMASYIKVAETTLTETIETGLYSDGTANNGKQLTGLATAVPIVTNTGTYGGIDRATYALWRTSSFDANSYFTGITQVNSTTIRQILAQIFLQRSRGKQSADILLMSNEHYAAYDAALVAAQRITERSGTGTMNALGFNNLAYVGAGREVAVVMGGGIGSAIPANTTFGLNSDTLKLRVNSVRKMGDKLFPGDGLMPINQDAVAQFIGFMGELTMSNPLFNWRLYDSNPAA